MASRKSLRCYVLRYNHLGMVILVVLLFVNFCYTKNEKISILDHPVAIGLGLHE